MTFHVIIIPFVNVEYFVVVPSFLTDSPHQFNEAEVNIHYRAPVTQLRANEQFLAEDALRRSAQMRRYQDSDLESRRSTSREREALARHHYTPTRESIPVHLNRYQRAFLEKESSQMANLQLARAMYDFHALSPREISVKKGDVVIIRKAIDHNWLEVEDAQSGLKVKIFRLTSEFMTLFPSSS